jgi:hypothetical protein
VNRAQGVAFDVGTSPHGLFVDLSRTGQETPEADNRPSLADQQGEAAQALGTAKDGGVDCSAVSRPKRSEDGTHAGASTPEVYRTPKMQAACRSIRAAAAATMPKFHYLELTDGELLHLVANVERARYSDLKDIKKGRMVEGDMVVSNQLWQKLQEVRALRMRNSGGVK